MNPSTNPNDPNQPATTTIMTDARSAYGTTTGAALAPAGGLLPAVRRISWGAVLAGALIAIVLQLALSLLGLGIGLGTIDPLQEQNPVAGIGMGAAIWWLLTMLGSLYLGATVASRLAGIPRRTDGLLHGLLTWSVVTLATFYLLTTAVGSLIGGVTGVAGRALSGVGSGIAAVAPGAGKAIQGELKEQGLDLGDLKHQARLLLRQTGKAELTPENITRQAKAAGREAKDEAGQAAANPQAAGDSFDDVIDNLTSKAENLGNAADRDAAVNVVMKRTGKSRAESEQIVDNWITTAKQAQVKLKEAKDAAALKARQVADAAAEALSKAALLAALGLGLGAAVSAFGGRRATPYEDPALTTGHQPVA